MLVQLHHLQKEDTNISIIVIMRKENVIIFNCISLLEIIMVLIILILLKFKDIRIVKIKMNY